MGHYGLLRDLRFANTSEDIRGSRLYGVDDRNLGKIDDVIFDHSNGTISYVVVDTGGWLRSKKFIVPADQIRASAKHEDDFEAPLTKERIEDFPAYDESDLASDDTWSGYENRYRAKWDSSPVMHREGTDRNITPTTQQMPGNSPSARTAAQVHDWPSEARSSRIESDSPDRDAEAAAAATERIVPAGADTVIIDSSAAGIGGRWDTFQSRLRERRKEVVAGCRTCAGESATKRGSESADTFRKAV